MCESTENSTDSVRSPDYRQLQEILGTHPVSGQGTQVLLLHTRENEGSQTSPGVPSPGGRKEQVNEHFFFFLFSISLRDSPHDIGPLLSAVI